MARNGSGTFSSPYPNFVSGTVISSTQVDANNSDIATALTQSIAVDGQSTVTANLPMNAKKLTGLAVGAAATDSLNLGQAQAEAMVWCGTAGGSANAITLAPTPAITAYAAGQRFVWKASGSVNTGATTVAISGLGTIALQDNGAAFVAGTHAANKIFMGILDTTSTVQVMQVQISGTDPLIVTSLTVSGTSLLTGVTTHGGNVVSDTDSTDDLGTTSVRWKELFVDAITATDQVTATGFTGTLDGILGSGSASAATVTTLNTTGAVTFNDAGADVDFRVESDGDANMLFVDGGNNRVGIGTATPAQKLSVYPDTDVSAVFGKAHVGYVGVADYAGFSHVDTDAVGSYALLAGPAGTTFLNCAVSKSINFRVANTDKMIITSAGLVGIGLAAPAVKLDVNGIAGWGGGTTGQTAQIVGANSPLGNGGNLRVLSNTTQATNIGGSLVLGGYYTAQTNSIGFGEIAGRKENATAGNTAGYLAFGTRPNGGNMTERMRINSVGSVLVGTAANIAASAKIFALGSGVGIALGYGTGSAQYRHFYMNSGDGAMYVFNNTNYGSFSAAGAWTNASDRRIKKDIVDIKYGLADVLKIQPRSYQMKEVAGDYIGLIAQEMEEIIPEVVSGDPEKQLTLDYGSLVAVAFKAIQEQQVIIESLKTRITALEG